MRTIKLTERLANAWAALLGRPFLECLPPAKILELKPGDGLLFESERAIPKDEVAYINKNLGAWISSTETSAAVLGPGIKLVAVRRNTWS